MRQVDPDPALVTDGSWFGDADQLSFGWLTTARGRTGTSGVLVLPPVGYWWWSSYRTLRILAERLSAQGHAVLRLQYHGTGNAAGSQWEPRRLEAWEQSVRDGAAELRGMGCEHLSIVGVHLGATLALEASSALGAEAVAVWQPVVTGRREVRALRVRSTPIPDGAVAGGGQSFAGTVLPPDLLAGIQELNLLGLERCAPRALLVDGSEVDELAEHLEGIGVDVNHLDLPGVDETLAVPAEDAVVADKVVDAVATWLGTVQARSRGGGRAASQNAAQLMWDGGWTSEEVVRLTPHDLVGVVTSPTAVPPTGATVVLLNSGSEPHVGPGRAWVELARDLALQGHRTLRVDFRGWGESPDDGHAPGRPYDAHCIVDTVSIVEALRVAHPGPIVLAGLCAGAWIALRAALQAPVEGVVALNPQLYWQPGDPVEALLSDTRIRRAAEREEEEEGRRTGHWDALDRDGKRNAAGAWLDSLDAADVRISLVFAEGDDGLEYLHNRLSRRLDAVCAGGRISVTEVAEVDHAMHRTWLRPRVFAAISDAVKEAVSTEDDLP